MSGLRSAVNRVSAIKLHGCLLEASFFDIWGRILIAESFCFPERAWTAGEAMEPVAKEEEDEMISCERRSRENIDAHGLGFLTVRCGTADSDVKLLTLMSYPTYQIFSHVIDFSTRHRFPEALEAGTVPLRLSERDIPTDKANFRSSGTPSSWQMSRVMAPQLVSVLIGRVESPL